MFEPTHMLESASSKFSSRFCILGKTSRGVFTLTRLGFTVGFFRPTFLGFGKGLVLISSLSEGSGGDSELVVSVLEEVEL